MTLREILTELTSELIRIHSVDFDWSEISFPEFSTDKNGYQVHFSNKSKELILALAEITLQNLDNSNRKIDIKKLTSITRQIITNFFASDRLIDYIKTEDVSEKKVIENEFKKEIVRIIELNTLAITHHYAANTIFLHNHQTLKIGTVEIASRETWIKNNEFSDDFLKRYRIEKEKNLNWKNDLLLLLENKEVLDASKLADDLYHFLKDCHSVLSVKIDYYERDQSSKLGKIICKTALDSVSLFIGDKRSFHTNILFEDKKNPDIYNIVKSVDGFLTQTGFSFSERTPGRPGEYYINKLKKHQNIVDSFGFIISGLTHPDSHSHPHLANRWATSLEWYSEAQRESNNAIALAKFGTALDILSCGGQSGGITDMICNLLSVGKGTRVSNGLRLKDHIEHLYKHGRSQILHGNHVERLQSFERDCNDAAYLTRLALLCCAERFHHYNGKDEQKAFRTMPAPQKNGDGMATQVD
ncbi:hypothetical protein SRABI106_00917 [Rahnella aquatilis]|nr:hypothetical protein SRABI106_00917 [Rahnella aquatilis]